MELARVHLLGQRGDQFESALPVCCAVRTDASHVEMIEVILGKD